MTNTLSIAALGAGYFSQFHLEAWQRNPATQMIAIADQDISKARETGISKIYSELDSMLASCSPDILDIITPPFTHPVSYTHLTLPTIYSV